MTFDKWLDTFFDEKEIDLEETFEIESDKADPVFGTTNFMNYGVVVEAIKGTTKQEQAAIKSILVKIDFLNGDVKHYLRHLAKAMVS